MKLNTIIQGDCLEVMRGMDNNSVDLVLTDPPYGTDFDYYSKGRGVCLADQQDYGKQDWNKKLPDREAIDRILTVGKNAVIFGGQFFTLPPSPCWIVWDKDNTGNWGDCELAWTSFKTSIRKILWRWNGMLQENMSNKDKKYHPTQKPIGVMKWIIEKYTKPNDLILDPFCGSGTTCVAAELMGRNYIGIEISEEYCQIARKRVQDAKDSMGLFEMK